MPNDVLDRLLVTVAVRLHAFSVCRIQRGWRLAFDPFDALTVHYVLTGSAGLRVGSGPWRPFGPRNILVVPAGQAHIMGEPAAPVGEARGEDQCSLLNDGLVQFTAGDGTPDTLLVCGQISASYGRALGLFDHLREPMIEDFSSSDVLRHAFDLMLSEIAEPAIGGQAMTEALMKQCLILLLRRHLTGGDGSPLFAALHDPRLARVIVEVLENPAAPHTVESLASSAGMSRTSFAERFGQVFGQAPIEFVQRVRLRVAARLLTSTDLPVKIICDSIGYASRSSFSRVFRATYGLDPKTYREVGGQEEREPERVVDSEERSTDGKASGQST